MSHYELQLILRATSVAEERVRERMAELGVLRMEFRNGVGVVWMQIDAPSVELAFHRLRERVETTGYRVVCVGPDDLNSADEIAQRTGQSPDDVARWIQKSRALRFPEVRAWFGGEPYWSWCEVADWAFKHRFIDRRAHKDAFELYHLIERLRRFVDQEDDEVNDFVQYMPTRPPPGGYRREDPD